MSKIVEIIKLIREVSKLEQDNCINLRIWSFLVRRPPESVWVAEVKMKWEGTKKKKKTDENGGRRIEGAAQIPD